MESPRGWVATSSRQRGQGEGWWETGRTGTLPLTLQKGSGVGLLRDITPPTCGGQWPRLGDGPRWAKGAVGTELSCPPPVSAAAHSRTLCHGSASGRRRLLPLTPTWVKAGRAWNGSGGRQAATAAGAATPRAVGVAGRRRGTPRDHRSMGGCGEEAEWTTPLPVRRATQQGSRGWRVHAILASTTQRFSNQSYLQESRARSNFICRLAISVRKS